MAEDKTCSGFGVEAKEAPHPPITWTDAKLAVTIGAIAGAIYALERQGAKFPGGTAMAPTSIVLLEAAKRLSERKEP